MAVVIAEGRDGGGHIAAAVDQGLCRAGSSVHRHKDCVMETVTAEVWDKRAVPSGGQDAPQKM